MSCMNCSKENCRNEIWLQKSLRQAYLPAINRRWQTGMSASRPGASWLPAIFAAALLIAVFSPAVAEDALAKRIDNFLAQPHFKTAHWGYLFVDLATGEVVLERESEKLFVPASTTKLFSTAAALDALGAD